MDDVIVINTDNMKPLEVGDDLYANRASVVKQQCASVEVSIFVLAYNRLEKTKRCVSSILEYTKGIDYELILFDNGSSDGTLEYFQSVPHKKKKVLRTTTNRGAGTPGLQFRAIDFGKYLVSLPNDMIVTSHWLENLIYCAQSDPRIGMIVPVSANTSNLQEVVLPFRSYEEMHCQAAHYNVSDPRKWEDRLRLVTTGVFLKTEAVFACGYPPMDIGFFHDFSDDDLTFRMRQVGYRTILAGDTWIFHDHNLRSSEDKDPSEFQRSLDIGRANFKEKHFGVDAWDDVNNYYKPYVQYFPKPKIEVRTSILGIDVRCGTPILDIKNWLRTFGIFDTELSAFTQEPKYWLDLKTICLGQVVCDREEFLTDSFLPGYFDYVLADRPLNCYHEPQKILNDMFNLCKKGGFVICKLENSYSFREYLNLLGQRDVYNPNISYNIPFERFQAILAAKGEIHVALNLNADFSKEDERILTSLLPQEFSKGQQVAAIQRMVCQSFLFIVEK